MKTLRKRALTLTTESIRRLTLDGLRLARGGSLVTATDPITAPTTDRGCDTHRTCLR